MQTFKKVIAASTAFVLTVAVFSTFIIEPFLNSEYEYYNDADLRNELSGSLDYLFVGASNGMCAFVPYVADEELGVCSYNLSGGLMTWYGRRTILEKEIERNPVKNVIIEISFDAFARKYHNAWGDNITLCRLDSFAERLKYLSYVSIADYQDIYGALLGDGMSYWITTAKNLVFSKILGGEKMSIDNVPTKSKGFHDKGICGMAVTAEEVATIYNSKESMTNFDERNIKEFKDIIDLCRKRNIVVTLVVVPHSDYAVFEYNNWDDLHSKWVDIADEVDCSIIDFNLLKNRYSLFRDEESFVDRVHMTRVGAETFTKEYSKIMKQINSGTDLSDMFYSSYSEMKKDSPYMKYVSDNNRQTKTEKLT